MGKHTNSTLYAKLEQQARRTQPTEAERASDWDSDEWEQSPPPRGFSDFYGWKIDAETSGRGIG
jgi:hypothetical protein